MLAGNLHCSCYLGGMQCCIVLLSQGKSDGNRNNPSNLTTDEDNKPYQNSNQDGEPVEESCLPAGNPGRLVLTMIIMASSLSECVHTIIKKKKFNIINHNVQHAHE